MSSNRKCAVSCDCLCHADLKGVRNPHQGKPCPGRKNAPKPADETTRRMCTSKRRYKTETSALTAAARLCRLGPQRAYPCPNCAGWHLTTHQAFTSERKSP